MFILLLIYISLFIEILLTDSTSKIYLALYSSNITVKENGIEPIITTFNDTGFFYFEIKPNDENSLFNVIFFKENIYNNFTERYYNQKKPLIYLDSNISSVSNKKMKITCSPDCDYKLYYRVYDYPILKDNSNFSLYYKDKISNKKIYYKPEITDLNSNNILINVMGKSIEDFPISFYYDNKEIKSEKNFINGKGLLITKDSGITLNYSKNFFY